MTWQNMRSGSTSSFLACKHGPVRRSLGSGRPQKINRVHVLRHESRVPQNKHIARTEVAMVLNPKSPIGRCSARLRRLLEIEEELALQWKVKIIAPNGSQHSSGRRWLLPASLGVPGPFSSRPVSADGKVSFHFSHETVTKGPGGSSILVSGSRRRHLGAAAAAEHEAYITRPEAVPTISAAEFEEYAAGPGSVGGLDGRTAAIFSNISDDPEKR